MDNDKNNKNQHELTSLEVISELFTSRKFEECLKRLEQYKSTKSIAVNQAKIFEASCWTHLRLHQDEALKLLEEVIQEEPLNPFAHFEIGVSLYLNGEFKASIEKFVIAADLHPAFHESSNIYISLANRVLKFLDESKSLFNSGEYTKSVDIISKALKVDENNISIQQVVKKRIEEYLLKVVQKLEDKVIDDQKKVNQLVAIEQSILENKFEEAEKSFPKETSTAYEWYLKGFFDYRFGKLKHSILSLQKALELEPDLMKAQDVKFKAEKIIQLMDEATIDMKSGKYLIAIEKLTQAMTVDPDNKRIVQGIYFQRSSCKYNIGEKDEAFRDYLQFEALQNITGLIMNGYKFSS
jgi:tetratricopeptide (TPR) repeat protein